MGTLAVFLPVFLHAPATDAAKYPFRSYRPSQGLPQSQVLSVTQDRHGEIWVGTWCGAAAFDGKVFRHVSTRHGLPSNYVYDIVEDPDGFVWLATGTGLASLHSGDPRSVRSTISPLTPLPAQSAVRDLLLDRRGKVWAATHDGAVARIDGPNTARIFPGAAIDTDALDVLTETTDSRILLASRQGLLVISPEEKAPRAWRSEPGPWNRPLLSVYAAPGGEIWLASDDSLHRVDGDRVEEIRDMDGSPIRRARSLLEDASGRVWIATETGLLRHEEARVLRFGRKEGLPTDLVYRVTQDREQNIWIGTEDGLVRYPGDLFHAYGVSSGLEEPAVWSLDSGGDGTLVAGTRSGLFIFEEETFHPHPLGRDVRNLTVRAVLQETPHRLWVGTRDDGLFLLEPGRQRQWLPPALPGRRVYSLFRDSQGATWVGMRLGLARLEGEDIQVWDRDSQLPDVSVWSIGEDPQGRILISTDRGLARLEGQRFLVPEEFLPLADTAVRSFAYRRDGTLWAGTNGRGVAVLENGSWRHLYSGDGPSDDFVWGITTDIDDRVWVATNHGIDAFDGVRWVNFSEKDGMPGDEIAVNAFAAARDGSVWFGFPANQGVVRFLPRAIDRPSMPPLTRIRSISTSSGNVHHAPEDLELDWQDRDVAFSFVGASFLDEKEVLYRTRLAPYDREWSLPSTARQVRYTNLEPGRYSFEVQAANAAGVWTASPARVLLEIAPPVWQRWWFRLFVILLATMGIATYIRFRTARVRRENIHLEAMVDDRTRSLEEKIEQIADLKEQYEKLSVTDPLTGLANRRHFRERIDVELARAGRHGEGLGLVLIDLDHFKEINDAHGHHAGDRALVQFARLVSGQLRRSDLVARWGGEEFFLALIHSDMQGSLDRLEELRKLVASTPIPIDGAEIRISLSAGFLWVSPAEAARADFDSLSRRVDQALYRAKEKGRNRIESA